MKETGMDRLIESARQAQKHSEGALQLKSSRARTNLIARGVIFLDIDGVLWSYRFRDSSEYVNSLQNDPVAMTLVSELATQTQSDIVISSSWRLVSADIVELKNTLRKSGADDKFLSLVVGMTPILDIAQKCRGHEIAAWIEEHCTKRYVIVDDFPQSEFLPNQRKHLVKTTMKEGFTQKHFQKAADILM